MTLKEKCELWLEAAEKHNLSDNTFDELSYILSKKYDKLPLWFRNKIPLGNLQCGTTLGLEIHKDI